MNIDILKLKQDLAWSPMHDTSDFIKCSYKGMVVVIHSTGVIIFGSGDFIEGIDIDGIPYFVSYGDMELFMQFIGEYTDFPKDEVPEYKAKSNIPFWDKEVK